MLCEKSKFLTGLGCVAIELVISFPLFINELILDGNQATY